MDRKIYSIGHSTHSISAFIALLESFEIRHLVDIRNFPGSKRFPHFNQDNLEHILRENNIHYTHLKTLGGRRKAQANSRNNGWRLDAFRGYADYMETEEFKAGLQRLEAIATQASCAYMCAEAVWWSCHRSLVSDVLKHKGWLVLHVMGMHKTEIHPYTKPARIVDGKLVYSEPTLFDQALGSEPGAKTSL